MNQQGPPSKLTDNLCRLAIFRVLKTTETAYDKAYPYKGPGEEFFTWLEKTLSDFETALQRRPLDKATIDTWTLKAQKAVQVRISKMRVKQPRFQELVHIESGETRMIPYVD